jgi:phospholipid/cholesterol/gamma-HCH transport system substrate-binding protein
VRAARHDKRVPSWAIGLLLIALVAVGSYFAFVKEVPWVRGYEVKAVFNSAQNVRVDSPVRIAGIDVGRVVGVEHLASAEEELRASLPDKPSITPLGQQGAEAAVVTMEISDAGRPIKSDAQFKLRPRLFLEGNYFIDVKPGSPSADEVEDHHTFPVSQTAYSVQLDQVLSTLQSDVRADLQTFLNQFGNALIEHGGADGWRELYRTSPGAYRFTAEVQEAFMGTRPRDLSNLIRNLDRVVEGFGRDTDALQGFITNLRTFSGSFAAEADALQRAIVELPRVLDASRPAYANLNASFPALRAFSREALPGVRSSVPALDAATPWIQQVRRLVSRRELRGLAADLRPTIPPLARLSRRSVPFLEDSRELSSCFNKVIIPWSNDTVQPITGDLPVSIYPHEPQGRVFEETGYGLVGIASESRSGDANGQLIKTQAGGGTNTVVIPGSQTEAGEDLFGVLPFPLLGAMPRITDSRKTPFRPDEHCEDQEPPNLEGGLGSPPDQRQVGSGGLPGVLDDAVGAVDEATTLNQQAEERREAGERAAARRLERRAMELLTSPLGGDEPSESRGEGD